MNFLVGFHPISKRIPSHNLELNPRNSSQMNESAQCQEPSDEEIAICAYLIWEYEGCPEGMDKVHWDQAEAQLIVCHAHDHWMSRPLAFFGPPRK